MTGPCAFCGHPDQRHRIVDAIKERIEAGERASEVLADYGWTLKEYLQVKREVHVAERNAASATGHE